MVCGVLPTANDCWACGAALKFGLPATFASMTHVPTPMNDTTAPAIAQTPVADASILKTGFRPEVEVAVTV